VRQWKPDPDDVADEYKADVAEWVATKRTAADFVTGTAEQWRALGGGTRSRDASGGAAPPTHIALSACESKQLAKEAKHDNESRGAFSVALVETLKTIGPRATYRDVLAAARTRVEQSVGEQNPEMYPIDADGLADTVVLDGSLQSGPVSYQVTPTASGWELSAGSIHGLAAPVGDDAFELACLDTGTGEVAGMVKVTEVGSARSVVVPVGWTPTAPVYDAVVAVVPVPAATIVFEAAPREPGTGSYALEAYDLVREVLASSGSGGGPSPHVRVDDGAAGAGPTGVQLRVAAFVDGYRVDRIIDGKVDRGPFMPGPCMRILRPDGTPVTADVAGVDEAAARTVAARLEHVAAWERLRSIGSHGSKLAGAVRLEIIEAKPGEEQLTDERAALPDPGEYRLEYRRDGDTWLPPWVFMRLLNTLDRPVYVAVLDFTDRFACGVLYPTNELAPNSKVLVQDGSAFAIKLPKGRDVVSGARARDWLRVVVSETNFDAAAFTMSRLDEPPSRSTRSAGELRSTLERLTERARTRDIEEVESTKPETAPDWCAETHAITVTVP
jgi:hypothetical protein